MKKTIFGIALIAQTSLSVASDHFIDFNEYYQDYSSRQVLCNEALIYDSEGKVEQVASKLCSYQPINGVQDLEGGVKIETSELFLVPKDSSLMTDVVDSKGHQILEGLVISNQFSLKSGESVVAVGASNYRSYVLSYLGDDVGYNHVFKIVEVNKFTENQHKIIKAKKRR